MTENNQMSEDLHELDRDLMVAYKVNDKTQIVTLYAKAGEQSEQCKNVDGACFYYTQAYIFALEMDHPLKTTLREKLAHYGREYVS